MFLKKIPVLTRFILFLSIFETIKAVFRNAHCNYAHDKIVVEACVSIVANFECVIGHPLGVVDVDFVGYLHYQYDCNTTLSLTR